MSGVVALKGAGVDRGTLAQLGNDTELKQFMVVCFWEDGETTCGWSAGITNGELVYGAGLLGHDIDAKVYGGEL